MFGLAGAVLAMGAILLGAGALVEAAPVIECGLLFLGVGLVLFVVSVH